MKTKIVKKMLAILITASTVCATPGISSAMHNGKKFIGAKRHRPEEFEESEEESEQEPQGGLEESQEGFQEELEEIQEGHQERSQGGLEESQEELEEIQEEHQEEPQEANNMIIEQEPNHQDQLDEDLKEFIRDVIYVNPYKYGNTPDRVVERIRYFLSELNKLIDNGTDKKYVAEIILKLIEHRNFEDLSENQKVYSYFDKIYVLSLLRYTPDCEFMVDMLEVLKKCQDDQNARPTVLKVISKLCLTIELGDQTMKNHKTKDISWGRFKYLNYLQSLWINQEKNSNNVKTAEMRNLAKETQKQIMEEITRVQQKFTKEEEELLNQKLEKEISDQVDLVMASMIDILKCCCNHQDSQEEIVQLISGQFLESVLKEKPVEMLEVLRTCSKDKALSSYVFKAVSYMIKNNFLKNNDATYEIMRDILNNCSDDLESVEDFLFEFVALSENPNNFFNGKREVISQMLDKYMHSNHKDDLKFVKIIRGAAQKNLLGPTHRKVGLKKITVCLENNLGQSETRSEIINVVADLIHYGWFNDFNDEKEAILFIIMQLANICQNVGNDRENVSRIISELADKGLLSEYLNANLTDSFDKILVFLIQVCSSDAEALKNIAKAMVTSLEKDNDKNERTFAQFVEGNIFLVLDILLKCSQNAENLKNVSKSMKYIFSDLAKVEDKANLAKIMNQTQIIDSQSVKLEEQIINILTLCSAKNNKDINAILFDCFQVLFDSYFKESDSKEIILKILDLLDNLTTIPSHSNDCLTEAKTVNVFAYIVKRFNYDFPKDKMLSIMFKCFKAGYKAQQIVMNILKELIIEAGKLDEYFVLQNQRSENDAECERKIFEMLARCDNFSSVPVMEIIVYMLKNNKLDDTERRSKVFKIVDDVLVYSVDGLNENSIIAISEFMLLFLEKYDLPDSDLIDGVKDSLAVCASCQQARKTVSLCIDRLTAKGYLTEADAANFKKQLLLQFI